MQAADAPATVRLLLPDETAGDFTLVTYRERMPQSGKLRRYGQSALIDVSLVAYRTQQTTGIIARWFDDLIGDADNAMTIADTENL